MAQIRHDCPHCGTRKSAFTSFGERRSHINSSYTIVAYYCHSCGSGVLYEYFYKSGGAGFTKMEGNPAQTGAAQVTNYYPQTIERTAPKHTPENVAEFFRQGSVALQSRSWDAAGMTFRKALDVSTKELRSDLAKERLVDRIDQMAKDGTVTPELGKWAHEIRISGNDAAHEDQPFSEEEANTLMGFVDLFLTYTFTLPGRLAERRQPPGAVDETS